MQGKVNTSISYITVRCTTTYIWTDKNLLKTYQTEITYFIPNIKVVHQGFC